MAISSAEGLVGTGYASRLPHTAVGTRPLHVYPLLSHKHLRKLNLLS